MTYATPYKNMDMGYCNLGTNKYFLLLAVLSADFFFSTCWTGKTPVGDKITYLPGASFTFFRYKIISLRALFSSLRAETSAAKDE